MNTELSQEIFRAGMRGVLINRHVTTSTGREPNPLYNELFENEEAYRELYAALPYEIVSLSGAAYYIRESEQQESYMVVARSIQVLMDIIARGMQEESLYPDLLLDPASGLPREYLERFSDREDFREILNACGMQKPLLQEVDNILIGRDIAYYNPQGKLVLTDGGTVFFNELHAETEQEI